MIAAYLEELQIQKEKLVDNLKIKGVDAEYSETFNSLVPKILDISGGGFKKLPLFVSGSDVPSKYAETVFTIFQNGIEALNGYINAWWVGFCTCNTYYFYGCGSCNRCNYCCNGKIQTQ